jgi:hypothetical protein
VIQGSGQAWEIHAEQTISDGGGSADGELGFFTEKLGINPRPDFDFAQSPSRTALISFAFSLKLTNTGKVFNLSKNLAI